MIMRLGIGVAIIALPSSKIVAHQTAYNSGAAGIDIRPEETHGSCQPNKPQTK
jgi:hypothetical protein